MLFVATLRICFPCDIFFVMKGIILAGGIGYAPLSDYESGFKTDFAAVR